jgi:hypothetical protein
MKTSTKLDSHLPHLCKMLLLRPQCSGEIHTRRPDFKPIFGVTFGRF